jgi:predicted phosphodiesterase
VRYLILSDIHGNLEALTAVVADAKGRYDSILNCGDLVGYGPDPNAVVDWCRENTPVLIRGNHDKACVGLQDLEWFNPMARQSAVWTNEMLTDVNREFLRELPQGPLPVDDFQLVHGSPQDEDEYLVTQAEALEASRFSTRALSFFGHTHVQGGFILYSKGARYVTTQRLALDRDGSYLINPGSVGQPRDEDPRAAYLIYSTDDRLVEYYRVEYDVFRTQRKIIEAGLPELLAHRLQFGK